MNIKNAASLCLCGKVIAVARDVAFCFIYPANLEWLRDEGAELRFFSLLAGEAVPQDADALWLPGGYPELHAATLAVSPSLTLIRDCIEAGMPALAECGGMMVLGESIFTTEAQRHREKPNEMAGILPHQFVMQDKLAGLGYREDASGVRGHEFHHSKRFSTTEAQSHREIKVAFNVARGDVGIHYKNLRASYIHWYFPSQAKEVASWFGV